MITFYKLDEEISLDDLILMLYYYADNSDIDMDEFIEYYDNDGDSVNIYLWNIHNKISKISDNQKCRIITNFAISIYVSINEDLLEEYETFLESIIIVYNDIPNTIMDYANICRIAMNLTLKEDNSIIPYDYYEGIINSYLYELDLNSQWAIIIRYDKDDEILYPYPDHKNELIKIDKDLNIKANIYLDNYIGYAILMNNLSDDNLTFIRLSLPENCKIITSRNIDNLYDDMI